MPVCSKRLLRNLVFILCIFIPLLSGCVKQARVSELDFVRAQELVDRGVLYLKIYDFSHATAAFTLSLEIAPSAAAIDGLGCVALLEGDFDEAEKLFKRSVDFDSSYSGGLVNLGLLNELRGDRARAKSYYEKALSSSPLNGRALQNYGALEFDEGAAHEVSRGLILQAEALMKHPLINNNLAVYATQKVKSP